MFKNNDERKIRRCDINIHKAMWIPINVYQTNKTFFAAVQPKKSCILEFSDNPWLPFLDQPQSDIVVFVMINFQIYNILVHKWKHGVVPNDIISFNE